MELPLGALQIPLPLHRWLRLFLVTTATNLGLTYAQKLSTRRLPQKRWDNDGGKRNKTVSVFQAFTHSLWQVLLYRVFATNMKLTRLIGLSFSWSLIGLYSSGLIHRRKINWQCWRMQPSPSDHPDDLFMWLFLYSGLAVTWLFPAPPRPRARASRSRRASCEPSAPPRGCGAPVPTRVWSSLRPSRSSRSRAGSCARSRAPGPAWWWGAGPAVLWRWRW